MDAQAVRDTEALTYSADESISLGLADKMGSLDDAAANFAAYLSTPEEDTMIGNRQTGSAIAPAVRPPTLSKAELALRAAGYPPRNSTEGMRNASNAPYQRRIRFRKPNELFDMQVFHHGRRIERWANRTPTLREFRARKEPRARHQMSAQCRRSSRRSTQASRPTGNRVAQERNEAHDTASVTVRPTKFTLPVRPSGPLIYADR